MTQALSKDVIVGVVGAGIMGAGIAQVAASAGHQVLLYDAAQGAAATGIAGLRKALAVQVAKGKLSAEASDALLGRISIVSEITELAGAGLVIEAIVERLETKRGLFAALEEVVSAEAILATNTSSISVTAIAAGLKRPDRAVGMHFFNPAPVMKLVEVVSGLATSVAIAERVFATASAWGKKAVHAKSTPGFIVNRVARPYYAEALRVVEENAAAPQLVDLLLTDGAGFRMGPFALMDLIGNDTNFAVTRSTFDAYFGDARYRPSLLQGELVAAGRLGRKSGQGYYDYSTAPTDPLPEPQPAVSAPPIVAEGDLGLLEPLLDRVAASGARVERRAGDGTISAGTARLRLTEGRPASLTEGPQGLALIDLADDYARVGHVAFSLRDGSPASVAADVKAFFTMAGVQGHQIDDTPGLIVARTLAMLANEAAEAVLCGISTAEDVDTAMRYGVNYPRGPLAWADRLGAKRLTQILDGMHATYGDDRYRASVRLRRAAASADTFHT